MENHLHPYFYPMRMEVVVNSIIKRDLTQHIKPFVEYSIIANHTRKFEIKEAKLLKEEDKNEVATLIYRDFDTIEVSPCKSSQHKLYRRINPNEGKEGFVELRQNSFILGQTLCEIKEDEKNKKGKEGNKEDEEAKKSTKLSFSKPGVSNELDFGSKEELKIGRQFVKKGYSGNDESKKFLDISRDHAVLKKKDNKFYIKDLYSTGGVYIPLADTEALQINRFGGLITKDNVLLRFVNQDSTLMIDYEIKKLINYAKTSIAECIKEPIAITPIGEKKYEKYKVDIEGFYKKHLYRLERDFEGIEKFNDALFDKIPINPIFSVNSSKELIIEQTYLEKLAIDTAYYNKNFLCKVPGFTIPKSPVYFYCVECDKENEIFDYLACDSLYRTYKYPMGGNVFMLCKDEMNNKRLFEKDYKVIEVEEIEDVSKDACGILAAINYVFEETTEEDKESIEHTGGGSGKMLYIVFPQDKKKSYREALNHIEDKKLLKIDKENIKHIEYSPKIFQYKEDIKNAIWEYKDRKFDNQTLFYATMKFCFLSSGSEEDFKKEELCKRSRLLLKIISTYEEFKRDAYYEVKGIDKKDRESKEITDGEYVRCIDRMNNLVTSKVSKCEEGYERELLNLIVELPNLIPDAIASNDFKPLLQLLINLEKQTSACNKSWKRNLEEKLLFLLAAINCIYTLLTILAMPPQYSGNIYVP